MCEAFFVSFLGASQMGLTRGGVEFRQNGKKLHENYKIFILGAKQWGEHGQTFLATFYLILLPLSYLIVWCKSH